MTMSKTKNKFSVTAVYNKNSKIIGYLSNKDEEQGLDIELDLAGYKLVAL